MLFPRNQLLALPCIALAALLVACSPPPPVQIGFIGGLTDRNSDNGQSGLNGVTLAIEQFNRDGGLDGHMVELVVRDDAQNRETAAQSAKSLVDARVDAVIGPFTSGMAEVIVPITGKAGIFQVSPTITSMAFYGKDDNLFRINRTTRDNARDYAKVMVERGQKRIAVAYDVRNRNFTEWLWSSRRRWRRLAWRWSRRCPTSPVRDADFAKVSAACSINSPTVCSSSPVRSMSHAWRSRHAGEAPKLPIGASEWRPRSSSSNWAAMWSRGC